MALSDRTLLNGARLVAAAAFLLGRRGLRQPAAAAFAGLWLYPTLRRNCQWHGPVATRFKTRRKEVWLTLDDGPDARCTPLFLDAFEAHGVRATFFAIGNRARNHSALCREIVGRGHTIENHSATHPAGLWWLLPPAIVRREIATAQTEIAEACGVRPQFFRSPVGMNGPWVHPAASAENLRVVGWSVDGSDGCRRAPTEVADEVVRRSTRGAIILLHLGDRVRHRLLTLNKVLEGLASKGLRCTIPKPDSLE